MYKGHRVAFCCAGCPAMWDKLSDAEKKAKLSKAAPTHKPGHRDAPGRPQRG